MRIKKLLFVIFAFCSGFFLLSAAPVDYVVANGYINHPDSLQDNQILYNGSVWRNLYSGVRDNQFHFTSEFQSGSVTISERTFSNVKIRYDVYNDEIMTLLASGVILQLNKEMVDSFAISYLGKTYYFNKIEGDSVKGLNGYVNVLCKGKSDLYVKYKKEIELLAVENKYDKFFETHRIYITKDGYPYYIKGRRDLLKLMEDHREQVKTYIKQNRIIITKSNPESFIPCGSVL